MNLTKFYEEQRNRLVEALEKADPLSEEYDRGLHNLFSVECELSCTTPPAPPVFCAEVLDAAETKLEVVPEAEVESEEPEEEKPEHPEYDLAFVRGRLSDARSEKGLDITALFDELGYENLSSVPKDEYWKLMEALDKALGERK